MKDPKGLIASDRPDDVRVHLVLESGRTVLLESSPDLEAKVVEASRIIDRYVALMTHPAFLDETPVRHVIDGESDDLFYGWFDDEGNPAPVEGQSAHYRFDVDAYGQSLRSHWRTDGCVVAELRRDDSHRGYVEVKVTVPVSLGSVRRLEVGMFSSWRLESLVN